MAWPKLPGLTVIAALPLLEARFNCVDWPVMAAIPILFAAIPAFTAKIALDPNEELSVNSHSPVPSWVMVAGDCKLEVLPPPDPRAAYNGLTEFVNVSLGNNDISIYNI
jgi:hypothetical protein